MRFVAKSEEDIEKENLMPEGIYDFEVLEAVDATSRKGNDMIKVNLGLYQGDAITWKVFDYLLESMAFKLRHFCDTTGLLAKYESGTLAAEDCKGRSGKVIIEIRPAKDGYPPQNAVKDYVCRTPKPFAHDEPPRTTTNPSPAKAEDNSDVPF